MSTRGQTRRSRNEELGKCALCRGPETDQMVQCDECDKWTHYGCAGVTGDVANHSWSCETCVSGPESTAKATVKSVQMAVPEAAVQIASAATSAAQLTTSSVTAKNTFSREQFVAEKLRAREKPGTEGKSQNVTDKEIVGNNARIRGTNEQVCEEAQSRCGSTNSKRNLRLELMRLEEKKKTELAYVEQKYAIMKEYQSESDDEELCSIQERTIRWANNQRLRATERVNGDIGKRDGTYEERRAFESQPIETARTLTASQISSRQVVSRDLPLFSGKPDEWPLFISSFENSTRLCSFSDDENLLRLQRALKGKAYEFVSSKLMVPALVPEIISTLKMVFGRPEHIFNNLIAKIRASPTVNVNRLDSLINLALEVKNLVATIEASGLRAHLNNPLLIQELIDKLPAQIRLQWAMFSRNEPLCTLKPFSDWLFDMAEAASNVTSLTTVGSDVERRKAQRVSVHKEVTEQKRSEGCYLCGEDHYISKCKRFSNLNASEKWEEVKRIKLCRRCLVKHDFKTCRNRKACGRNGCTFMHHPLLHNERQMNTEANPATVAVHHTRTSNVLFRIVPITIYGSKRNLDIFAFLDDGSGPTLIEESVLKDLDIEGPKRELCLSWADGTTRKETASQIVNLNVSQKDEPKRKHMLVDVRSVKNLDLPSQTLHLEELLEKYKHFRGFPLESYYDVVPKLIIGVNNRSLSMPLKYREGKANEPAATKTRLGWAVYGTLDNSQRSFHHQLHICQCSDDASLQELMLDAVRLDQEPIESKDLMPIELEGKVMRNGDRFEAQLLWKRDDVVMPSNRNLALRRLKCFEEKLLKNEGQRCQVIDHIKQMENKGYVRKLAKEEVAKIGPRTWYLPMFNVQNPNKPGKIRIVWDAAAKYEGVSLNDQLDKGPDLIVSLTGVLYNFRVGKIGICGDITEMFHQVRVTKSDQDAQRFLWRDCDSTREPDTYVLQVLSFGASCSPALALYAKNKNAMEFERQFPTAARCIIERHYVDDMLDSTIQDAIKLANDVREIHARGGFRIRNWLSNSAEVLQSLGEHCSDGTLCKAGRTLWHAIEADKVLGMWWLTQEDCFTFNLKFTKASSEILRGNRLPTKRELLRLLMSIFDPLGLLSYFTIHMKILVQNVWRSQTNWDDMMPEELADDWWRWLAELNNVERVRIPRCYFSESNHDNSTVQLHVFVDASEHAYATVAYFRNASMHGVETSLVGSKTKVAPLRPISIPRMELLAAVLGARLAAAIAAHHCLKIERTFFWSDSKTVLLWLRSDPRKYKHFVKFRVAQIQESTETRSWNYVPTKLNVADLATKWSRTPEFNKDFIWFTGPAFLKLPTSDWPEQHVVISESLQVCQENVELQKVAATIQKQVVVDTSRFSKWERLLRALAYAKLFIENLKAKAYPGQEQSFAGPTRDLLRWSEQYLLKLAQNEQYAREVSILEKTRLLPKDSPLRKLSPFTDDLKIIRMRSRLENNIHVPEAMKNPIILPRQHRITYLIVDWYHRKFKHVNHETVINEIFQKYHIPGLRVLLRSVRTNCQFCKIRNANPLPPVMSPLPAARTAAYTKPFSHVGIDFFGPLFATIGRRSEKRYGVVFTCLTCRAVHIEVAHSLTMSSCIMAVRNFIARRGVPDHIYSDNGTNLRAAEKELRKAYNEIDFDSLKREFTGTITEWTFIPPASPHMGGAWERMVRSIKRVLYQIVTPETKLNDEKLLNLLLEVESIINHRPLTYLSLETAEQEALTPNHLLLGTSSGSQPPGDFDQSDQYVKSCWRHTQYLADRFWKRWIAEVLPDLTRRTKWYDKTKPIQVGDVVIVVDGNLPRHCWPKGVVTNTIQSKDGQIRSATVRTKNGEYHRPVAKLAILDIR